MRKFLHSPFRIFFLLGVIGFAIYVNVLKHPFVHDDVVFIQQNPNISRWDDIAEVFLGPKVPADAGGIQVPYYRPLLEVVYRLEFLFFGMNPLGFHAVNILFHVMNAFFVFLLSVALMMPRTWAFLVALIFLVHPLQSEAVACISGISNLVMAFFGLATILAYLMARRSSGAMNVRWSLASAGFLILALLAKEQAVVIPVLLLAYEFLWRRGSPFLLSAGVLLAGLFSTLAGYLFWRQMISPGLLKGVWENPGELFLRMASIPRMLLDYLGVMVCPLDLHYYRSLDILLPNLVPALWLTGVMCLLVAFCSVLLGRMGRWGWFGLAWFMIAMLPVLNIVPLINEYSLVLAAEHFLYLPLAGVLICGTTLVGWVFRTLRGELSPGVGRLVLAAILVALAVGTVCQNSFWRGEIPLFERTVSFEPGFGRAHLLLARAYAREARFLEALGAYARGLRIMEDYVKKAGHSTARDVYRAYVQQIHFERGECLRGLGRLADANEAYQEALEVRDIFSPEIRWRQSRAANHWALNLLRMGERGRVKELFELALVLDARNIEAMNNLGMLCREFGQRKTAVFWFECAIRRNPLFRPAWENLKQVQDF